MRKKLILGQAFLLFFILIFFFFLWFQVKGNPLLYLKAGRAIQDYYEEYYQDLDLKKGEITYHQDDQSYTITPEFCTYLYKKAAFFPVFTRLYACYGLVF